jgi:hypothetical protein
MRPRLQELIAENEELDDPLNLLPDLAKLRAIIVDFIERYDQHSSALIAWHESFGDPERTPKPTRIIDISAAGGLLVHVGKMVALIQKQKAEGSITMATLDDVMRQMGSALVQAAQETIDIDDTRTKLLNLVESRWGNIRIDPRKPGG